MHLKRARDNDDWNMRQGLLELRKIIQAEFSFIEDVVEQDQVGLKAREIREGFRACADSSQLVLRERILVNFILQVVVLNNKNDRLVHSWVRILISRSIDSILLLNEVTQILQFDRQI